MKTDQQLLHDFEEAFNLPFSGWDFTRIQDRMKENHVSWDYRSLVLDEIANAKCMLDMGTGGGEFLSTLVPLPEQTFATEAYTPNIPIAKKRLEPLGVEVFGIVEDDILPFTDNSMDLIINRHESYLESELYRIMKKGSRLITQQVGGENQMDLNRFLGDDTPSPYDYWHLDYAVDRLKTQGFTIIDQKEEFPVSEFTDVEAVIYYLKAIPWQVEYFSVHTYFEGLKRIKEHIKREGSFKVNSHRFLIVAEKR